MSPQATSKTEAELTKLQAEQEDMATKLAAAERELNQLRSTSRTAEFELVSKKEVGVAVFMS